MGIFDKLKNSAMDTVMTAATSIGNKNETFTFTSLPESLGELQALPEAALDTPFQTAALTVLALCAYAADRQIGQDMLNWMIPAPSSCVRGAATENGSSGSSICSPVSAPQKPPTHGRKPKGGFTKESYRVTEGQDTHRNQSGKHSHWIEGADHENSSIYIIQ